jgi:hypothetical protein
MSLKIVNFGAGKGGLLTVGYTIYGVDGAVVASRSTVGVSEIGTSTGIYAADVIVPDYDAIVLWDTGEATPRYATEDYQHQIQDIINNTGRIQNIFNSIKNINEFLATLMDKLGLIQKNEGLVKVNQTLDALAKKESLALTDIEEAFSRAAKEIKLTIPETKTQDYSSDITQLKENMALLQNEVNKIPKSQKEYSGNFSALLNQVSQTQNLLLKKIEEGNSTVKTDIKGNINSNQVALTSALNKINAYFDYTKNIFSKFDSILVKISELSSKLASLDTNDKDIISQRKSIADEISRLNQFIHLLSSSQVMKDYQDANNMLYAFGHKRGKK